MSTLHLLFKNCTVHINDAERWLVTEFPDGTFVHANPNTGDHDLIHTMYAMTQGEPHCPVLWRLAHGDDPALYSDAEVATREAIILRIQGES